MIEKRQNHPRNIWHKIAISPLGIIQRKLGNKMLEHEQLWNAIDNLAKMHGYSTSGLAKKSGLDATIFNKSKRVSNDGRSRWPTTESIAKVLETTGQSMGQFAVLMQNDMSQHDFVCFIY